MKLEVYIRTKSDRGRWVGRKIGKKIGHHLWMAPYLSPDSSGTYSDHPISGGTAIILDMTHMKKMAILVPTNVF